MKTYLSYVKAQSAWNPCLSNLEKFLSDPQPHRNTCHIVALEFFTGDARHSARSVGIGQLRSELQDNQCSRNSTYGTDSYFEKVDCKEGDLLGRILIVEDLTKEVIEVLGSCLDIDPLFFAGHIHSPWMEISYQTPEMATLPSRTRPEKYANIHYHRAIEFKEVSMPVRKLLRDANVPRKVMVLPLSENLQHIGLAQHCTSIFKTTLVDKTWLGLVLVDPPIKDSYLSISGKTHNVKPIRLISQLFSGGFEDFLDPPSFFDDSQRISALPRDAIKESLLYYWTQQTPQFFDPKDPTLLSLSYYPLKLVAAEWNKYAALMRHCIKQYEYSNKELPNYLHQLEKLHADMRALQSWRRRSISSQHKIDAVSRLLRFHKAMNAESGSSASLAEDFEHLAQNVESCGRRLENMLPVVTYLVQIVDSQRSFAETANISRLTILALIFVPLAFVATVLGMNSEYGPGGSRFWVYFVVAFPVTLAVYFVACLPVEPIRFFRQLVKNKKQPGIPL